MPTSQLFTPNGANSRWTSRGSQSEKTLGKGMHAEIWATGAAGAATVMLIEQDAFPCGNCDEKFLGFSKKGKSFVFRVTEDGSGDRKYHVGKGLAVGAGYPCLIYYVGGVRAYNAAPADWPASPAV